MRPILENLQKTCLILQTDLIKATAPSQLKKQQLPEAAKLSCPFSEFPKEMLTPQELRTACLTIERLLKNTDTQENIAPTVTTLIEKLLSKNIPKAQEKTLKKIVIDLKSLARQSIHEFECTQPSACDTQQKANALQDAADRFTHTTKKPSRCSLFCCCNHSVQDEETPLIHSVNGK